MTVTKCPTDKTKECDARYVLKVWLYGVSVIAVLGTVSTLIAATSWKKDMEYADKSLTERVSKIETTQAKIDSIYNWVRPAK